MSTVTPPDPDARPGERIRRLLARKELACERYQRGVARATGLSDRDVRVLVCIARHGELTTSLLASRVGSSAAALGPLVARLIEAQLLERRTHPRDGRSSLVRLSEEGAELLQLQFAELAERIDLAFEGLPARDQRVIGDFLARLADASAEAAVAIERRDRGPVAVAG